MEATKTALKKMILLAVQTQTHRSYKEIAREWGVCESTVSGIAVEAGAQRQRGRLPRPPKDWSAAERRAAFRTTRMLTQHATNCIFCDAVLPADYDHADNIEPLLAVCAGCTGGK